jgi:hypothetical protein
MHRDVEAGSPPRPSPRPAAAVAVRDGRRRAGRETGANAGTLGAVGCPKGTGMPGASDVVDCNGARAITVRTAWKIRIELEGIRPTVWRQVLVSEQTTLARLHRGIQDAFGWLDYHLHEFHIRGLRYGDPENDEYGELDLQDETEARLRKLPLGEGSGFEYVYDFGDDWEHSLRVEEIRTMDQRVRLPTCLGGARARPPEDVGGIGGYGRFLRALADETDPEHDEYLTWVGGAFDPERFDVHEANRRLLRGSSLRRGSSWSVPEWGSSPSGIPSWHTSEQAGGTPDARPPDAAQRLASVPAEHESRAHSLALRRDVETLLAYLRDHRVTGTQTTGNLPLKAVAEISARFVEPPALEQRIGRCVHRFRSEKEVWPLYFVHVLAWGAELLSGGPGRRWRLTGGAVPYLSLPSFAQVAALLTAWWHRVDWLIAAPRYVFGGEASPGFRRMVLSLLRALPVGRRVQYAGFMDRLVAQSDRRRQQPRAEEILDSIRAAAKGMVVQPLAALGVLSTEAVEVPDSFGGHPELFSVSLTDFGQALLQTLG